MKSKFYMIVLIFLIVQITSNANLGAQRIFKDFRDGSAFKIPTVSKAAMDKYYNSPEYKENEKLYKREDSLKEVQKIALNKKLQNDLEITFNQNVEKIKTQNNTYESLIVENWILFVISIALFILIIRKSKNLL